MLLIRLVTARAAPHNDKYPVNTSHRSDLCADVSLRCYLAATVIHTQSVHSQIHILHSTDTVVVQKKYKYWGSSDCRVTFWARVP